MLNFLETDRTSCTSRTQMRNSCGKSEGSERYLVILHIYLQLAGLKQSCHNKVSPVSINSAERGRVLVRPACRTPSLDNPTRSTEEPSGRRHFGERRRTCLDVNIGEVNVGEPALASWQVSNDGSTEPSLVQWSQAGSLGPCPFRADSLLFTVDKGHMTAASKQKPAASCNQWKTKGESGPNIARLRHP